MKNKNVGADATPHQLQANISEIGQYLGSGVLENNDLNGNYGAAIEVKVDANAIEVKVDANVIEVKADANAIERISDELKEDIKDEMKAE